MERTPPQSGDTFWQLELMDAPYSGQLRMNSWCATGHLIFPLYDVLFTGRPLRWNDRCRIQHLPSQLYVTVVKVTGIDNMYQVGDTCLMFVPEIIHTT